jgi:hypothetical protein
MFGSSFIIWRGVALVLADQLPTTTMKTELTPGEASAPTATIQDGALFLR